MVKPWVSVPTKNLRPNGTLPLVLSFVLTGRFMKAHGATVGSASSRYSLRPKGTFHRAARFNPKIGFIRMKQASL
jgi:hypothetical protein